MLSSRIREVWNRRWICSYIVFQFLLDHLVYLRQFERGQYPIRHAIGVHLPHDERVPVTFHRVDFGHNKLQFVFRIHIPVRHGIDVDCVHNGCGVFGRVVAPLLVSGILRLQHHFDRAFVLVQLRVSVLGPPVLLLRRALSLTEYRWLFSANRRRFRWDNVAACCMQREVGSPPSRCGWFTL